MGYESTRLGVRNDSPLGRLGYESTGYETTRVRNDFGYKMTLARLGYETTRVRNGQGTKRPGISGNRTSRNLCRPGRNEVKVVSSGNGRLLRVMRLGI